MCSNTIYKSAFIGSPHSKQHLFGNSENRVTTYMQQKDILVIHRKERIYMARTHMRSAIKLVSVTPG
jgi:hypothetical protein